MGFFLCERALDVAYSYADLTAKRCHTAVIMIWQICTLRQPIFTSPRDSRVACRKV